MGLLCIVLTSLTYLLGLVAIGQEKPAVHVLAVLEKVNELELYSLDPSVHDKKEGFHGYKVLGKTLVKDAVTHKRLVASLKKGVEENKGYAARCFIPRHGIRCKEDGTTMDLLICFECLQVMQFYNEKGGPGFLISKSPQPTFDKVLKDSGIALPKGPNK